MSSRSQQTSSNGFQLVPQKPALPKPAYSLEESAGLHQRYERQLFGKDRKMITCQQNRVRWDALKKIWRLVEESGPIGQRSTHSWGEIKEGVIYGVNFDSGCKALPNHPKCSSGQIRGGILIVGSVDAPDLGCVNPYEVIYDSEADVFRKKGDDNSKVNSVPLCILHADGRITACLEKE